MKQPDVEATFRVYWDECDRRAALGEPIPALSQHETEKRIGRRLLWRSFLWGVTHPFGLGRLGRR